MWDGQWDAAEWTIEISKFRSCDSYKIKYDKSHQKGMQIFLELMDKKMVSESSGNELLKEDFLHSSSVDPVIIEFVGWSNLSHVLTQNMLHIEGSSVFCVLRSSGSLFLACIGA